MSKEAALSVATGQPVPVAVSPQGAAPPATTPPPELASTVPAHLAKKEAEIVRQQQQIKKDREQLAAEKAQAEQIVKTGKEFQELRSKDPVAALRKLGFSETEIFNFLAAAEKPEPTAEERAAQAAAQAAEAKIKEFQDLQAKQAKEKQENEDRALINEFKATIPNLIKSDAAKFEYCNHYGEIAEALIYETVLASARDSQGKDIMTAQEAAELVENYYEEQDKSLSGLKKRTPVESPMTDKKPVLQRTRTVTPGIGSDPQKPVVTRTRALSNRATATVASTTGTKTETREEKRTRLENMLRNGGKA